MSIFSQFKQLGGLRDSCAMCEWFEYVGPSEPGACHYKYMNEPEGYEVDFGDPYACGKIQECIDEELREEERRFVGNELGKIIDIPSCYD